MNMKQTQKAVANALSKLEPTDVRVHQQRADVLNILVISPLFRDMPLSKRISACMNLLCDTSDLLLDDMGLHYLFTVEPVTAEEFKERLIPWPA